MNHTNLPLGRLKKSLPPVLGMLLLLRGLFDGRFSGSQKTVALEGGHEDLTILLSGFRGVEDVFLNKKKRNLGIALKIFEVPDFFW